jgi:hypothetical protein
MCFVPRSDTVFEMWILVIYFEWVPATKGLKRHWPTLQAQAQAGPIGDPLAGATSLKKLTHASW